MKLLKWYIAFKSLNEKARRGSKRASRFSVFNNRFLLGVFSIVNRSQYTMLVSKMLWYKNGVDRKKGKTGNKYNRFVIALERQIKGLMYRSDIRKKFTNCRLNRLIMLFHRWLIVYTKRLYFPHSEIEKKWFSRLIKNLI